MAFCLHGPARPGHERDDGCGQADAERELTNGAVIPHLPAAPLGLAAQRHIGVDGHGGARHGEHGDVIDGIGVGGAATEVEPLNRRQGCHGVRLAGPVEDIACLLYTSDAADE